MTTIALWAASALAVLTLLGAVGSALTADGRPARRLLDPVLLAASGLVTGEAVASVRAGADPAVLTFAAATALLLALYFLVHACRHRTHRAIPLAIPLAFAAAPAAILVLLG